MAELVLLNARLKRHLGYGGLGLTNLQMTLFIATVVGHDGPELDADEYRQVLDFIESPASPIRRGSDAGKRDALDFIANPDKYRKMRPFLGPLKPTGMLDMSPASLAGETGDISNLSANVTGNITTPGSCRIPAQPQQTEDGDTDWALVGAAPHSLHYTAHAPETGPLTAVHADGRETIIQ